MNTKRPQIDVRADDIEQHIMHIGNEFREGFKLLRASPKSVTIFGSSQVKSDNPVYKQAEELASRIVRELGYAVITGGGPGVMEAANKGAFEAGGTSTGFNISLPHEHSVNKYVSSSLKFSYFFSRKAMLSFAAEAYVFLPGGFGTFDELFSILTLIQTGKIPHVPLLLYGSEFWNKFDEFIRTTMFEKFKTVEENDLLLYKITDSTDHIIDVIKKAPVSDWWRNIN